MESQEQDASCAETGRAVGRALFDVVERERDFADGGERGGHTRQLYLFLLSSNCKKSRGFAGFFVSKRRWKQVAGAIFACCKRIEFPLCFLRESGISGKHVLFPTL